MPVTEKQLIANRQNAQKSTGPRTETGKRRSSQNAVKHGLRTTDTVINSPHLKEDPAEYKNLITSLIAELNPDGAFQTELVHKIANCLWRQRRAINAETAHLNQSLAEDRIAQTSSIDAKALTDKDREDLCNIVAKARSIPTGLFSLNLLRYELRNDLQLARSYKLLRHLQRLQKTKILQDYYDDYLHIPNEPISPQLKEPEPLVTIQAPSVGRVPAFASANKKPDRSATHAKTPSY